MGTSSQKKEEEGPRSFTRFLERVDDGQGVIDLSTAQHKLMKDIREIARSSTNAVKGALTLKLTYVAEPNGTVDVLYDITIKEPKRKRGRSVFFLTPGANLTVENPRQLGLGLPVREVRNEAIHDVDPDNDVDVREV